MSDSRLELRTIQGQRPCSDPEREEKLFAILNDVLQPDAYLDPTEAATLIDGQAPKFQESDRDEGKREQQIEEFMSQLWFLLFQAMRLVPREHSSQARAIALLDALCQVRGDLGVRAEHGPLRWRHLPCFTQCMIEDFWRWEVSLGEMKWINLNSFAARLLASGLFDAENGVWDLELFASIQLRKLEGERTQEGLEDDLTLAEEWITHAGGTILQTAHRNSLQVNVSNPGWFARSRENVLSIIDWEHWKRCLLELGVDTDGDLSQRCLMLAHKMEALEERERFYRFI